MRNPLKPEMVPMLMKGAAAVLAVALWYFFGKPVDQTSIEDVMKLIAGVALGKEFLSQTKAAE